MLKTIDSCLIYLFIPALTQEALRCWRDEVVQRYTERLFGLLYAQCVVDDSSCKSIVTYTVVKYDKVIKC